MDRGESAAFKYLDARLAEEADKVNKALGLPSPPPPAEQASGDTPRPEDMARLLLFVGEVAEGKVTTDPEIYALLAAEVLAPFINPQQENKK